MTRKDNENNFAQLTVIKVWTLNYKIFYVASNNCFQMDFFG